MPVIAAQLLAMLGHLGIQLLMALLTEDVLKKVIILGLEKLSAATKNDTDDKLLAIAKQAWGVDQSKEP